MKETQMMKENIVDIIIGAVVPIAIISIILFTIIMFIRLVFYILIFLLSKIYFKNKKKKPTVEKKKDIVPYFKAEEELSRNFEKEKKQEKEAFQLQGVERMEGQAKENETAPEFNEGRIVDIAKPIGFWTSLVLGDQLTQILGRAQSLNNRSHKGFWVSMLEAQARGSGRQHSKGRDF